MTEPIDSVTQFPVQGVDPFEADPHFDDQLPVDPLLESGTFIDAGQNGSVDKLTNLESKSAPAESGTATAAAGEDSVAADVTPSSQRQRKKLQNELVERPNWLPGDWNMEVKVRTSGATAGSTDRYYISPSGQRLRSKNEVIHYLETGTKLKRKLKTVDGASASDNSSGGKQKKSKEDLKNFAPLGNFDFNNPPHSVDYVATDDGDFNASVNNKVLSESEQAQWDKVFWHVTQLDSSRSKGTYT
ncbi:hypothetical protein M9H77_16690 [Catharanthus roseus]|uniref:Uncharacterized protein n=1 Tax=Catharanthus roseus TaxID=4058 RepID=A0ACC0B2F6_CATRO|nr:hypothetical protein M9H77_16690 [Catharanthus roseus]